MTSYADDNWVRRFTVSDPKQHSHGFTIYKVTSIVFPKGSPEAVTKVVVWKRYNDFKKLHCELQQKHKKLYLPGKFPPFAEAKFFRRFEDVVIEERRKCAAFLLEFIGAYAPLFASDVFVKFFKTGYNQDECKDLYYCVQEQSNASADNTSYDQQDLLCPVVPIEPNKTKSEGNGPLLKLGGTWQYPKVPDSISLSSQSSEERISCTDTDSVLSGPNTSFQREESQELSPIDAEQLDCPSMCTTCVGTEASSSPPDALDAPVLDEQDYIAQATHHTTQSLQQEAAGAYDAAFSLMKVAISSLLTGVQDESDASRRQAVRKKASEYLAAAEKLYSEHLAPRFPSHTQLAPADQSVAYALPGLQSFKVLGVIGKVMLAMSTEKYHCYIVKVLYKSPCPVNKTRVPILPHNVPYMVKLHFYFETDSSIFLFLQHARGGRLWDHIISYLQSQPPTPVHLFSRGNVYLGRKLIDKSPSPTTVSGETILSVQDDSYATLIQNYREGRCKRDSEVDCGKSDLCNANSNYSMYQRRKDIHSSYPSMKSELQDHLRDSIADSSHLNNPSENVHISTCIHSMDSKSIEHLETKELMKNAQQLLQSVNETLLKTSIDDQETLNEILTVKSSVPEECTSGRMKGHMKYLPLQHQSSGTRPPLERPLSSDDLLEWHTYSASGGASMRHWEKPIPRLPEIQVRQWAEQIVVCLASLHESGLVYRDLHPDNMLLSEEGHLLLSFTCSWPAVDSVVNRDAVQNFYAAPEVTSIFEATPAVDWWSLGALLFELLTGKPLHLSQPGGVHNHSILCFPDFVSAEAQSLLTELLRYHPQERLGTGVGGVEEIKSHPFFAGTDWSVVHFAGLKAQV